MNSISFCVVYVFAVVMVRVCNADSEVFSEKKATHYGPFNFKYNVKNFLLMEIVLTNIPPSVTAVYVVYSTKTVFYQKDPDSMPKKVQAEIKNAEVKVIIQRTLEEHNILLDVELQTRDGLCRTSRVAEGRSAGSNTYYRSGNEYIYWHTGWKYDETGSCLVPNRCEILMDFKNQCQENFNCYIEANEYICTFQTGKLKNLKSFLFQTYDTDEPRTKVTFREQYTYLEAVDSFYKIHKEPKTWNDAKRVCAQEGASLFYPENSDEAKAVISFWGGTSKDYLWVGISDLETEGVFVTVDGRLISEVYNKWRRSQPDNYQDKEHCVHITKNSEYNDIPCDVHWCNFICKRNLLQNIQLDLSSVIGAPLNTSAMVTNLIFELELFDNNTSINLATPRTRKLQRSDKIILTADNVVKEYIVKEQPYSETTEVQFSCEEYRQRSKYLFVALINATKKKIQTFKETRTFQRKFKMADSGSILCCLYYVYGQTNNGHTLQIKRFVLNKTLLTYRSKVPVYDNHAGIQDQAPSPESNDYSWVLYVLSAFLGISVLMFALFMISKQRLFTNPQSVEETVELDAPALQNEVLYASLDFVNNRNQPQSQNEESHYAEIIGVLHTH